VKKKLAILRASYLQLPLVKKCKDLNIETHVFAWRDGCVVDEFCDYFYDISILDKERILEICRHINIDGVISIGSDIAMPSVNYIANQLKLTGNSLRATLQSTNKFEMRQALLNNGIKCPKFKLYKELKEFDEELTLPVIVKPTDSSGSRGVTKVTSEQFFQSALAKALSCSMTCEAIVEEFIEGKEYSVEGISIDGEHEILAITEKVTTGSPYFVEVAHHQPAFLEDELNKKMTSVVVETLNALGLKNGASHTELFVRENGDVAIVESAGRMGGEWIGSHITPFTTGFDFVKAVVLVALGEKNIDSCRNHVRNPFSGVFYITPNSGEILDIAFNKIKNPSILDWHVIIPKGNVIDSVLDGAGKRAAIVFYSGINRMEGKDAEDFIKFKIK